MDMKRFEKMFEGLECGFTNEHGELYKFYFDGMTIYFGGDETDNDVMMLFNNKFNIWSTKELKLLAGAIQGLAEQHESKIKISKEERERSS